MHYKLKYRIIVGHNHDKIGYKIKKHYDLKTNISEIFRFRKLFS